MFPQRPRQQIGSQPPFQRPRPPFSARQQVEQQPPRHPMHQLFHGHQQQGDPRMPAYGKQGQMQSLMQMFQTPDGHWDLEKIMATAQQVNGVYQQVSPLVSNVSKLFKKD